MLVGDNRVFPIRNMQSSGPRENFVSLSNSATSDNTLSTLDSLISKDFLIKNRGSDISTRVEKSFLKNKKKTNVKEAVITEEDHEREDSINKSDILSSSHLGKNIKLNIFKLSYRYLYNILIIISKNINETLRDKKTNIGITREIW